MQSVNDDGTTSEAKTATPASKCDASMISVRGALNSDCNTPSLGDKQIERERERKSVAIAE